MNNTTLTIALILLVAPQVHAQTATATPEQVMANNDLNKDGVITKEEATKVGRQLAQYWDYFDLNKDGKVDMDELKKVLGTTGQQPAPVKQ